MKPKEAKPARKGATYDQCQTPPYALKPLLPFLPRVPIWEPAAGEGMLSSGLKAAGFKVIEGDIITGQDFFETPPPQRGAIARLPTRRTA